MPFSEFARSFALRSGKLSWLLGAGTSFGSGIPTATEMIWEFKRAIYCTENKRALASCADLTDPALQAKIQQHFDSKPGFPEAGSDGEYSFYFEAAYPTEQDRRSYIADAIRRGKCSYGQLGLASLMVVKKTRGIFTTNFDPLIEDAHAIVAGSTGGLTVVKLEDSEIASQSIRENRFPLLVKIHGDFRSEALKNTTKELQEQDGLLRKALVEECRSHGLVVTGYSGRDKSVMDALADAIDSGRGFPNGLFWLHKGESVGLAAQELVNRANQAGAEAKFIEVETFDEMMSDILDYLPDVTQESYRDQSPKYTARGKAPLTSISTRLPQIRTNAFPLLSSPTSCRLLECAIGGTKEVRKAIQDANVNLIGARIERGVILFGSDADAKTAFGKHEIKRLDIHTLHSKGLGISSSEVGLLYDALTSAIANLLPVDIHRGRESALLVLRESAKQDPRFANLIKATRTLAGVDHGLRWAEALRIQLDFRLGRAWVLAEPTVWMERASNDELRHLKAAWINARLRGRYNSPSYNILKAWDMALFGDQREVRLRAIGCGDGMDAEFVLAANSGVSGRNQ